MSIGLFWASLYLYVPVLPIHVENITGNLEIVGIILSAYAIAQLTLRIPIGLLADKIGKKKLSLIAIFLSSAGAVLLMFSNTGITLFLSRTLTGLAAAGWVPISVLYSSYFKDDNADRSMSQAVMINSIGLLSSTYFGGLIAENYGIDTVFIISAIFGVISGVCMLFSQEPHQVNIKPQKISLKKIINKRLLGICATGSCLFYLTFSTIYGFIPIYLTNIGTSETMIGVTISLSLTASLIGAGSLPKINQLMNNRKAILFTWILMITTTIFTPIFHTLIIIIPLQFIGGFGRGIMTALLMSLVIKQSNYQNRSTSMGIYQSLYSVGMFLGPFISGIIAGMIGVESIFYFAALICFIGMIIGMFITDTLEINEIRN